MKWRPSTSLRYARDERMVVRWLPRLVLGGEAWRMKWRPSTSLRYAQDERVVVRRLPRWSRVVRMLACWERTENESNTVRPERSEA